MPNSAQYSRTRVVDQRICITRQNGAQFSPSDASVCVGTLDRGHLMGVGAETGAECSALQSAVRRPEQVDGAETGAGKANERGW